MIDPKLLEFAAGPAQVAAVKAAIECGTISAAARKLGQNKSSVSKAIERARRHAALRGYSPAHNMTHTAPSTHIVKGVSTLYGPDGDVKGQWVKTAVNQAEMLANMREAISDAVEEYRGVAKPVRPPARSDADLLTAYPIGDAHIGMYAWSVECGEDFDTTIARNDLIAATSRLVDVAPSSERAVIVNLGDWVHADSVRNETTHGTRQDVDTRWPRVLKVGCMLMIDLIGLALRKHQTVEVINAIGNHDEHASVMLSAFCEAFYHNEPRVIVHPTVGKFSYIEHGKTLIGVTHGDTIKINQLDSLMAADKPAAWGKTDHRYWYTGHIHHTSKLELRGCVVESFRTLAAKDSWHTAQGYRSGRDMYCIIHDKEDGEIERHRCDIRRARHAAAETRHA